MTDLELIAIVVPNIEAILASRSWPFVVVQKDQPTQQGIPSEATVFFEILFNRNYGTNRTDYAYDETSGDYTETETQAVISKFQISCLVPQNPSDTSIPTAQDVLEYISAALAGRHGARLFQTHGVNIFKVSEVRTNWFEDDNHQFENHPTFDLDIAHEVQVVWRTPASIGLEPKPIPPYGSGTFPV